jgi:hypothetical protein
MPTVDVTTGQTFGQGWFYDTFSDDVKKSCTGMSKQRVAFTTAAKPPTGVTVPSQLRALAASRR